MADATGRSPLHWAICTLARNHYYLQHPQLKQQGPSVSMKTINLLLDHYQEALVTGDLQDKTPLHLLFDSVKDVQEQEWKRLMRNKAERNDLDLKQGGRKTTESVLAAANAALARNKKDGSAIQSSPTGNFLPPVDLLAILVSNCGSSGLDGAGTPANAITEDRSAVFMEDTEGRLPIHAAMEVASSPEVIKLLIKAHPTSLVHTTEDTLISPLHAAVLSPYVAPLQTPETMRLILRAYVASRHGTYVDGRLALKMEDADGFYPIHYACKNQVCLEVLQLFVEEYPKCALLQTPEGDLPLHCLLDRHVFDGHPDGMPPLGASLASSKTWSSPKEEEFHQMRLSVLQQKIQLLVDPILNSNQVQHFLTTPSYRHGMLPLHIVVAWGAASYKTIKLMLDKCADAAEKRTTVDGHTYSPLDLHENYKLNVLGAEMSPEMDQEWQYIRELLFSFSPLLEGHRHMIDILTQSARVVRAEIGHVLSNEGEKSYHWTVEQLLKQRKDLPPIEMSDTFTSIEVPDIDHGGRPLSKKAIERSRQATTPKKKKTPKNSSSKRAATSSSINHHHQQSIQRSQTNSSTQKKSIYDDDALDTGYIVSDGEQDDSVDFDEDYFSGPESAEEYLSDESDERFDSFDDEEYGDPTVTTAESWDTSGAAHPASSKESANRRSQNREAAREEKKEEEKTGIAATNESAAMQSCGPQFSEVGLRLLTFFMLYCDDKNPSDNYASLTEGILDEVSRSVVDEVISMPLPPYASQYLEDGARLDGVMLREVASPKCRELIHRLFYFLGRFDFRSETGGILLGKTADSATVQIRSTEWIFSTEEYNEAPKIEPGVAEAQVWETGVIPPEEVGYMGATFKAMRRSICFLFTKNAQAYYNEVNCRADLGVDVEGGSFSESHIVPLISHFNATSLDRKQDRMYKNDCNNESFVMLDIFGQKGNSSTGESICLADYPYALVFPYSNYGDLFDYFFRHGVDGIEETREICTQIGRSLSSMHERGIIHGNIAMRNIVLFPPMEDLEIEEGRKHWALTNLSGACRLQDTNSYMGKLSVQGTAEFHSASLPPEMFVKLTNEELKAYREYWEFVEKEFGAEVDRSVIEPVVDFQSGASYVMRCHYVPTDKQCEGSEKTLPSLPYKLLPARESADIWAFGQLLFMLCSCGRPLFPTNARTGNLLNYKEICNWDMQKAEAMIYEHVENALAQDILLRLLAPYEKRSSLAMETLLNHPFFNDGELSSSVSRAIAEKRSQASTSYRRWMENNVNEKSEEGMLQERTIAVSCWDFDFQTRIHLTPTALIPEFLSLSKEQVAMPCSFLILPYKLVRNKKGVLTPPSKRDVERAERLGHAMLSLSKACHFVNAVKRVVNSAEQPKTWSFTKIFGSLDLAKEDFIDLESRYAQLGSEHVEQFRSEPVQVGLKLIREHIRGILACYEEASKVSLFLVDEYKGVPVVSPSSAPFPHSVQSSLRCELARHGLPFMYLCARYFRGISGVPGFVKLIFEAAAPHVPPSWQPVCKGLDNSLDHQSIINDMNILCDAMVASSSSSIDDSFEFMQRYIGEVDPRRMYANMKRVSCGEAAVWTGADGVKEIQEAAKDYGFKEAIESKIKMDQQLKSQEARIRELEEEVAKLRFRKDLALHVPEEAPAPASSLTNPIFSPTGFAAELYQRGMKCMEANVDIIASRTSCNVDTSNEQTQETSATLEANISCNVGNEIENSECDEPDRSEEQPSESEASFGTPDSSPKAAKPEEQPPSEQAMQPLQASVEDVPVPPALPIPPDQKKPGEMQDPLSHRHRHDRKWGILGSGVAPSVNAAPPSNSNKRKASQLIAEQRGGLMSVPTTPSRKASIEPSSDGVHSVPSTPKHQDRLSHDAQVAPFALHQTNEMTSVPSTTKQPAENVSTLTQSLEIESAVQKPAQINNKEESDVTAHAIDTGEDQNMSPPTEAEDKSSANALLSYLEETTASLPPDDFIKETTVEEAHHEFSDALLENVSFECIDVAKPPQSVAASEDTRLGEPLQQPAPQGKASDSVGMPAQGHIAMPEQGQQPLQQDVHLFPFRQEAIQHQETAAKAERPSLKPQSMIKQEPAPTTGQEEFIQPQTHLQPNFQAQQEQQTADLEALKRKSEMLMQPLPTSKRKEFIQPQPQIQLDFEEAQQQQRMAEMEALKQKAEVLMQPPPASKQKEFIQQQPEVQLNFQAQQGQQMAEVEALKEKVLRHDPAQGPVQKSELVSPPDQQSILEPQVDSCFAKISDGAEEVKTLLDDMFAEADLVFSPTPRTTPKASQSSSRPIAGSVQGSNSPAVTLQETRDEEGRESSTISSTVPENPEGIQESAAFLEVTHKELSELKQTLIAGRATAKEARAAATPTESISEMFQKEMENFHTELKSFSGPGMDSSSNRGIVGRTRNIFSSPKSERSSREESEVSRRTGNFFSSPKSERSSREESEASAQTRNIFSSPKSEKSSREESEVSGSAGESNIEAGSVKRLTNFFLAGGKEKAGKPTIDVNPDRPTLSSPQSRLRRAAMETNVGWD